MIYLYSKGSGENEQEGCTLILRPLILGIFGLVFLVKLYYCDK